MSKIEPFEIYGIRYHHMLRKGHECMQFCPAHLSQADIKMDYSFWVLKNDSQTFVVDTAYTPQQAAAMGRTFDCDPMRTLQDIGVKPAEVDKLIMTHLHYDHAGNIDKFPNALVYLHEEELNCATGWFPTEPAFGFAYHRDHIKAMIDVVFDKRIYYVRGDMTIAPGLEVYHIPGHSPGHLSLRIFTKRGWILLAVDAAHFYSNIELRCPFPFYMDLEQTMLGYKRLLEIEPDINRVLPGHDGILSDIYPSLAPEFEGRVFQLDAVPAPRPKL